jgi:uncharacterized protein
VPPHRAGRLPCPMGTAFRRHRGRAPAEAAAVLDLLQHDGIHVVAPPLDVELPDPDDLPFLEVAEAAAADALVTGNERHFRPRRGRHEVIVLSPGAFLQVRERDAGGGA